MMAASTDYRGYISTAFGLRRVFPRDTDSDAFDFQADNVQLQLASNLIHLTYYLRVFSCILLMVSNIFVDESLCYSQVKSCTLKKKNMKWAISTYGTNGTMAGARICTGLRRGGCVR